MTRRAPSERGSSSILVVAVAAVTVLAGLIAIDAYRMVAVKAQTQTAADAAALAAAPVTFAPFGAGGSPQAEAAELAEANGARLVACDCAIDRRWLARRVEVRVVIEVEPGILRIGEVFATASAEFDPTVWLDG